MLRPALFLLCIASSFGCAKAPLAPLVEDIGSDFALGRSIERDTEAPMQTDSLVYHLKPEGAWLYTVEIPFRYRNDTGRTISIVNCRGGLNIGLEKHSGDGWVQFYSPALLMCLSPPIPIRPGAAFAEAAWIGLGVAGGNSHPEFAPDDMEGEFRLVWHSLVHGYDRDSPGFGSQVGPLRSNPFLIVRPE